MNRYEGFSDLIDRMVVAAPESAALRVFENEGRIQDVTWAKLAKLVELRAAELANGAQSCEAVLMDGSLGCVVEVFAAVRARLQVALLDPMMPDLVLAPLLKAVDADCVWASSDARRLRLQNELKPVAKPAFGAGGVLFFTSGTTASSKAVVLTDESLMSSAFNGASLLPLSPDDTLLCLLPLSHVFGFVCGLLWGLACKATVALGRGARHYCDDFEMLKPTAVAVVPKLLEHLVARNALNDELSLVLVGAADCASELLETVRCQGIRTSLGYGLTETSSGIALSTASDFHAMKVCPDDEVRIAEDGEVLVKAPTCLMQGYYRDEAKTADVVRNGWLHTGDKGFIDADGLLHVEGRLKDVLTLSNGTKVFLPDYEAAVMSALGERDVAVVLQQGKLVLVCGQLICERSDNEILSALEPAMASHPPASRIARIARFSGALPRTAAGDVERWKLQEENV